MLTIKNRVLGCAVGIHVGDSLGGPYETWDLPEIAADLAKRDGLTFFDYPNTRPDDTGLAVLPAGMPTDDTDQTACLAKSLIVCNGLDTTDLYARLRENVVDQKSLLWSGPSIGAGKTTRNALSGDPDLVAIARSNPVGSNGALMRVAPLAIWYGRELMQVDDEKRKQAAVVAKRDTYLMADVTHAHAHAQDATWLYVMILASLLAGNQPRDAIGDIEWIDPDSLNRELTIRVLSQLRDGALVPQDPGGSPMRSAAEFSLYAALYCLIHTKSFAEGIEMAIRIGGDTDTYAAIAGGLLGAYYGYEAIPDAWRRGILGHDVMVGLGTALYQHSFGTTE